MTKEGKEMRESEKDGESRNGGERAKEKEGEKREGRREERKKEGGEEGREREYLSGRGKDYATYDWINSMLFSRGPS